MSSPMSRSSDEPGAALGVLGLEGTADRYVCFVPNIVTGTPHLHTPDAPGTGRLLGASGRQDGPSGTQAGLGRFVARTLAGVEAVPTEAVDGEVMASDRVLDRAERDLLRADRCCSACSAGCCSGRTTDRGDDRADVGRCHRLPGRLPGPKVPPGQHARQGARPGRGPGGAVDRGPRHRSLRCHAGLARPASCSVARCSCRWRCLALAALGARRIDVLWVGKAGTFGLLCCLPLFLLGDERADVGPGVDRRHLGGARAGPDPQFRGRGRIRPPRPSGARANVAPGPAQHEAVSS